MLHKRLIKIGFAGVIALAGGKNLHASHIMGGELCYTFVGYVTPTTVRYYVQACFYRDPGGIPCGGSASFDIYMDNPPFYSYVTTVTFPLNSDPVYPPPSEPGCPFSWSKPWVERCCYSGYVDLPVSTVGYHIVYDFCCRPFDVDNLLSPGSTGFTFYNYIPPTIFENSSPCFTDPAVPWLCQGDTICFSNSAYEPDGDELFYKLAHVWDDMGFGPFTGPSNIPLATYAPGYDYLNPFGPLGWAFINGANGTSCFYSPNTGQYVVGVDVLEYRASMLISRTRRDYEILVDQCPPNDPPNITVGNYGDVVGISQGTVFYVTEGDTFCLPISSYDPQGDSTTLVFYPAPVYNPGLVNPPAEIILQDGSSVSPWPSPVYIGSRDTVSVKFCWVPCAGTARTAPYNFSFSAIDYGCPSKQTTFVVSIFVTPFEFPPDSIVGPEIACLLTPGQFTTVDTTYPYTYEWYVLYGGQIIGPDTERVVTVQWDTVPPHVAQLMVIKRYGPCRTDTLYKLIYLDSAGTIPLAPNPNPLNLCYGDTGIIEVQYDSNLTYTWTPNYYVIGPTDSNVLVVAPPQDTTYTIEVSVGLCKGEAQVQVYVHPIPEVETMPDQFICMGDQIQLNAWGADYFTWTPDTFLTFSSADPANASPVAAPDTTITYIVEGRTVAGCKDTASITVYVYPVPDIEAQPDTVEVPPGTPVNLTAVDYTGTVQQFQWYPPTWIDDPGAAQTVARPENSIVYVVSGENEAGCRAYDTVVIIVVAPIDVPNAFTPNGDGINDYFGIVGGAGITEFKMQIFNRWGEVVFETDDPTQKWDGTYKGKPQPPGTYALYIRAVFENGKVFEKKGSILLIR